MDMSSGAAISERIREIRRRRGLTQAELAERLGVQQKKISDIERGRTLPNPEFLIAVRERMGVTIDWLLTGEGPQEVSEVESALSLDRGRIGRIFRELNDLLKEGGLEEYLAEEQAAYDGAAGGRLIPVFDIEGKHEMPYHGELPIRISERHAAVPPSFDDPDAFACRLHGDSMVPEFSEGDILIFSPAAEVCGGDYVCARIGEHSTFRQMFPDGDIVRLAAVNRRYPELRVAHVEVSAVFRLVYRISKY